MKSLPRDFLERMKDMLGSEFDTFIAEYDKPPKRGLRVNTLKIGIDDFLHRSPFALSAAKLLRSSSPCDGLPCDGLPCDGFVIDGASDGVGTHPYHHAGLYYVQEPSAMLPAAMLNAALDEMSRDSSIGLRVLDMCAAPGGKTGAIAAHMHGQGMLVANEYVKSRAKTLVSTIERLGVTNAIVTSAHPDALANALPEFFDAVIVDAPCSGEGMFRKDDTAIAEWSLEHVNTCAARQLAILKSAVRTLRIGGTLVYSTCTFSHEENEGVLDSLIADCAREEAFKLELCESMRLYPHTSSGEGHFAAKLKKTAVLSDNGAKHSKQPSMKLKPAHDRVYDEFAADTFISLPNGTPYTLKDGRVLLLPFDIPAALEGVYMLSAGIYAGDIRNSRFEPSHALFMAEHGGEYAKRLSFAASDAQLKSFLLGQTLDAQGMGKGYAAVAVEGHNLGFGKISDGTLKNHLPKGLRLLK